MNSLLNKILNIFKPNKHETDIGSRYFVHECPDCNKTIVPGTFRDSEKYHVCREESILNLSTGVLHFRGICHGSVGIQYKLSYDTGAFKEEHKLKYKHPDLMKQGMCGGDEATIEYVLRPLRTGLFTVREEKLFRSELKECIIHHIWVVDDITNKGEDEGTNNSPELGIPAFYI